MEESRLATVQDLHPSATNCHFEGKEDFDGVGVLRFASGRRCHRMDRLDCISLRVIE